MTLCSGCCVESCVMPCSPGLALRMGSAPLGVRRLPPCTCCSWIIRSIGGGAAGLAGSGAMFGSRWRRCRVYGKASVWLHQPDEALLLRLLVHELELAAAPPPATDVAPGGASASDPDDTDMLPAIAADRPTEPLQAPAFPPSRTAPGGWSDLDQGGAGMILTTPGLAMLHSNNSPPPHSGRTLLLAGGMT